MEEETTAASPRDSTGEEESDDQPTPSPSPSHLPLPTTSPSSSPTPPPSPSNLLSPPAPPSPPPENPNIENNEESNPTKDENSEHCVESHSATPRKKALARAKKRLRKRTALFTSPKLLHSSQIDLKTRVKSLENEIQDVLENSKETKDYIISEMNDESERSKNGLKILINEKHSLSEERYTKIIERLTILEDNEKKAHQSHLALKDRVSKIEKEVQVLKNQTTELMNQVESQSTEPDPTPNPSRLHPTTDSSGDEQDELDIESVGQTDATVIHARPTPTSSQLDPTLPADPVTPGGQRGSAFHVPNPDGYQNNHHPSPRREESSPSSARGAHAPTQSLDDRRDQSRSYDTPCLIRDTNQTHLFIGGSCIRGIQLPQTLINSNKVCIPGLTVDHLRETFENTNTNTSTKHIIIHVGVNDCKSNTITCEKWTELIFVCKETFPYANITMSSIIPSKANRELRERIRTSNDSLRSACSLTNTKLTTHDHIFLTDSGAPRQALYRDTIHPGPKGVARFAENLFGKRHPNRAQRPPPPSSMSDYPPLPKAKEMTNPKRPFQPPQATHAPPQAPPTQPITTTQEPTTTQNQTEQNTIIQHPPTNHLQAIPQYRYPLPPFGQPAPLPQMTQYPILNYQNQMTLPPVYNAFWPPFIMDQSHVIPQFTQPRFA